MSMGRNVVEGADKFFTLKEFAEAARVSTRTLMRYIKTGKVVAVKFGGKWKIADTEFKRLMSAA